MPLSLYRTGTYINRVFKKYNVIDDIAELIDKQVHKDRMKVICWVIEKTFGMYSHINNIKKNKHKKFLDKAFVNTNKILIASIINCNWYNAERQRKLIFDVEEDSDDDDKDNNDIRRYDYYRPNKPSNDYPNYMTWGSYYGRGKSRSFKTHLTELEFKDKVYTDFQQNNMFKMKKGFKIAEMVDIFIKNKIPFTTKFNKKMFIEKWFKWVPEDKNDKKDKKK